MSKITISPFKTLSADCPAIKIHEELDNGISLERNEFIKGYTCENDLKIKIKSNIYASAIFNQLGLGNQELIIFIARCRSPDTMYIVTGQSQPFNSSMVGDIEISLCVPKGMAANTLFIDYSLVLLAPTQNSVSNVANRVGDILWEFTTKFLLEGIGSMFPTSTVNFPTQDGGKFGAWKLDWSRTSLNGSPSRVRLLLNGLNKEFLKQISPENNIEPNQAVVDALYYSVACSILEYAVRNEEEIKRSEFELGTLGDLILIFLNSRFKVNGISMGKDNVINKYKEDPEGVRAILQSNLMLKFNN